MYGGNLWVANRGDHLAAVTISAQPAFGGTVSPSGVHTLEKNEGNAEIASRSRR